MPIVISGKPTFEIQKLQFFITKTSNTITHKHQAFILLHFSKTKQEVLRKVSEIAKSICKSLNTVMAT